MKKRSVFQTQWAAQFAVASELCKRGYQVALTLGNHPIIDLMVVSPIRGERFVVDVKGQYRRAFWPVKRPPSTRQLFYIFAFVPDEAPNRFFIMTPVQVTKAIEANLETWIAKLGREGKKPKGDESTWFTGG